LQQVLGQFHDLGNFQLEQIFRFEKTYLRLQPQFAPILALQLQGLALLELWQPMILVAREQNWRLCRQSLRIH
jgi:hypothetical protein